MLNTHQTGAYVVGRPSKASKDRQTSFFKTTWPLKTSDEVPRWWSGLESVPGLAVPSQRRPGSGVQFSPPPVNSHHCRVYQAPSRRGNTSKKWVELGRASSLRNTSEDWKPHGAGGNIISPWITRSFFPRPNFVSPLHWPTAQVLISLCRLGEGRQVAKALVRTSSVARCHLASAKEIRVTKLIHRKHNHLPIRSREFCALELTSSQASSIYYIVHHTICLDLQYGWPCSSLIVGLPCILAVVHMDPNPCSWMKWDAWGLGWICWRHLPGSLIEVTPQGHLRKAHVESWRPSLLGWRPLFLGWFTPKIIFYVWSLNGGLPKFGPKACPSLPDRLGTQAMSGRSTAFVDVAAYRLRRRSEEVSLDCSVLLFHALSFGTGESKSFRASGPWHSQMWNIVHPMSRRKNCRLMFDQWDASETAWVPMTPEGHKGHPRRASA